MLFLPSFAIENLHPPESSDPVRQMNDEVSLFQIKKAIDGPRFEPLFSGSCTTHLDAVEQLVIADDNHLLRDEPIPARHRPDAERHTRHQFGDCLFEQLAHPLAFAGVVAGDHNRLIATNDTRQLLQHL